MMKGSGNADIFGWVVGCVVGLGFTLLVYGSYDTYQKHHQFRESVIRFEYRCSGMGGLTLQSMKHGNEWIGCYKDGKELANEDK